MKTWDDTTSTCDSGVREKFFEDLQSRDDFGPWNHLQSLDSASLKRSHSYLSSDLSSGVPSTTETLGWPGTSPPDSGPAFVTSENTLETQHSEYADACTPINLGVQSYVTNHERHPNPAFHSGSPITYARTIQNNQFYGVAERCSGSNDTDYDIYDPHLETSSSHQPDEPVSPQQHGALPVYPIHPLSDKYDGTTACQLNEPTPYHEDPLSEYAGFTHPQTATISIEGTSERFQSDTASSFPPTAGFFPEYWPVSAKEGIRPKARPASRSFALRPASRNSRGNKKPSVPLTEPSLSVIHEDGKGGVASSSQTTKKGRRAGPLSRVKAAQAAKNRKEKSVCIRCKMMKQAVSTPKSHEIS